MINLLQLENNSYAKIVEVLGGFGLRKRLESMGLRVGSKIYKISDYSGPVIVRVGNANIAIGRGMASKIIVERA